MTKLRKKPSLDRQVSDRVHEVSYEILREIVGPVCEIQGIMADIHRADLACFADSRKQRDEVLRRISEKYGVSTYYWEGKGRAHSNFLWRVSISWLALQAIEAGKCARADTSAIVDTTKKRV